MTVTCGTTAGYQRHYKMGERPCQPCREASAEYKRRTRKRTPRILRPCGTEAAYRRHLAHGEPPCDECRQAKSEQDRLRRPPHPRTSLLSAEVLARAAQLLDDGCSYAEVARTVGVSKSTLTGRLPGRGMTREDIIVWQQFWRRIWQQNPDQARLVRDMNRIIT